jgi:FKBP-type peptidyl-prolyl cis-trans isomerase 2
MTTFSEGNSTGAVEFVLDEGQLMFALELSLKEMQVGSRACVRVSEEWAQGAMLPSGSPVLRGAAIWLEITLIWVSY